MENTSRIEECLIHADKYGYYSIGSDIVHNPPSREYVIGGVHVLRNNFNNLRVSENPDDKRAIKDINKYFLRCDSSRAQSHLYENLDKPISTNIVEWISTSSDHDLEQFCIWSLKRNMQLTESINRDKPTLVDHAHKKTAKLEKIGFFPKTASRLMEHATDEYNLKGMDTFFSGGRGVVGFCLDDDIVLSNQYIMRRSIKFASPMMKRYMFHEYLHGAGRGRGFLDGIKQPFYYNHVMDEAFVEHATVVAHSPFRTKHNVIHPKQRSAYSDLSVYTPERTFLAVLSDNAGITIEQLAETYFSKRGEERGDRLREEIERKIGKFFGTIHNFFVFADIYQNTMHPHRDPFVYKTINSLVAPPSANILK